MREMVGSEVQIVEVLHRMETDTKLANSLTPAGQKYPLMTPH